MSNQGLIIEERPRDIGEFLVGRLLPFRKKRMVGPFIFIDHMGPSHVQGNFDVGPHPHVGLSTLTYLFEGEIMHRDSLGTAEVIKPGAVNWMTAGKGIVHSERTPDYLRSKSYTLHGYQIWVALPKKLENMEPGFFHASAETLPSWGDEGMDFLLVAGEAYGFKSPVPVYSPLYMIDVRASAGAKWSPKNLYGETAICVVSGSVKACQEVIPKGNLLVAKPNEICELEIQKGSHLLIFGGEPFAEERHIYWNFVATDKERIEQAKRDWQADKFPIIAGESGRIPLPS